MRELTIAGHRIADDTDAWVCAEIGCNHQGSVDRCKEIIRAAAEAGASAVKLQKRDMETWAALDPVAWAKPRDPETSFGPTEGEHRAALELGWDEYVELKAYAEGLGLTFFATAWDVPSLRFLVSLGVPAIKLASASIVNVPLIEACADTGLPLILSTGGATMHEIEDVIKTVFSHMHWNSERTGFEYTPYALLQCTAEYPCEPKDMNLQVIPRLRERYRATVIGLSDHYVGIALTAASYLLGARIIEKHFTISRAWKGSDQAFSLEPVGLRKLVRDLHRMREAMGDGLKRRYAEEVAPLVKMGRRDLVDQAMESVAR